MSVVTALIASIDGAQWSERDWLELALAAADQGGASLRTQDKIAALLFVPSMSKIDAAERVVIAAFKARHGADHEPSLVAIRDAALRLLENP